MGAGMATFLVCGGTFDRRCTKAVSSGWQLVDKIATAFVIPDGDEQIPLL